MIKGLPLAYNKDFQEDKEALFDAFRTTRDCVEAMAILFEEGLDFRVERLNEACLLYTSPSPRDMRRSRMPSSA